MFALFAIGRACFCPRFSTRTTLLHVVVMEGMDVVTKIEAVGSGSGTPSKKVVIVDSGELKEST